MQPIMTLRLGFGGLHHFKALVKPPALSSFTLSSHRQVAGCPDRLFRERFIGAKWQIHIRQSFLFAGRDRLLENIMSCAASKSGIAGKFFKRQPSFASTMSLASGRA